MAIDEVVTEATANSMGVSRVLTPFVARVIIANPLQVKAIGHAQVKTDKMDAVTLASLRMAGDRRVRELDRLAEDLPCSTARSHRTQLKISRSQIDDDHWSLI